MILAIPLIYLNHSTPIHLQKLRHYYDLIKKNEWYYYVLDSLTVLLIFIGIIMLFMALKPSYRKANIFYEYKDGSISIPKSTIIKLISCTIQNRILSTNVKKRVKIYSSNRKQYISVKLVIDVYRSETSISTLQVLRTEIKDNLELLTGLPVKKIEIQISPSKSIKAKKLL